MEGLLLMTREETRFATSEPDLVEVGTVLATVNDALRRRRRWPAAIIDRGCARCDVELRWARRNGSQSNKETDA